MVGVARHAVAQDFRVYLRAPRHCVLVFFQNDHPRALTHDEPVTVGVVGTARFGWIVCPLRGQRLAGVEPGDPDFADRGLGAARDHHVRRPVLDHPRRVADGMRPRRTGRDDRMVGPAKPVADAHMPRNKVDQRPGHEER